jgi:glycosyltransferase involved in cell wall biosynthesis
LSDLLLTSYVPNRTTGRGLRTCGVIAALARRGPVEVAWVPFGGGEPAHDLIEDGRISLRRIDSSRGPRRLLAALLATSRGAPWDHSKAVSPEVIATIRGAAADVRLILDGPSMAAAALPLARRREAVFLSHNVDSAFRDMPRLRSFERRVFRGVRESWMCTRADMSAARALAGEDIGLRLVPNVVDVAALPHAVERPGEQVALFVGDFTYRPNQEGLAYLVDEVMPLVWRELPEAILNVVGRGVETPPADPRVHVLGFVDDLDAEYARADAVAVPLLSGGGSPLKFIEALARGLPVVATSHAAALIEDGRAGEHFLAAPDAQGFAAALVTVLSGKAGELGLRGRELAQRSLSVDSLAAQLGDPAPV